MPHKKLSLSIDKEPSFEWNNGESDNMSPKEGTVWEKIDWIISNSWHLNHNTQYINILSNEVLFKLKEALTGVSTLYWDDIEKLWEYLKEKSKIIRLYTPKDGNLLELDLINIYWERIKDINYSNCDFNVLSKTNLENMNNRLRYDVLSIIDCLCDKKEPIKWEEMEFFWRELLNIWVKINIINHYIEYKKNSEGQQI